MAVIDQYFKYLVEAGGSDLHLSEGQPPKVRVNGTKIGRASCRERVLRLV